MININANFIKVHSKEGTCMVITSAQNLNYLQILSFKHHMISKWNHCFFTVSSCQWYTVWYSLIQTTIYIHMNDAGIPVKKNQNILYNLLVKSINEIKKQLCFSNDNLTKIFSY